MLPTVKPRMHTQATGAKPKMLFPILKDEALSKNDVCVCVCLCVCVYVCV